MKMKNLQAIVLVNLMFLNINVAISSPIARADVTIDWNSFTISTIPLGLDPAPVITWFSQTSQVNLVGSDSVSVGDWTTSLAKRVGTIATFSDSDVSAATIHSYSEDNDLRGESGASIFTSRTGEFSVSGSGTVRFLVSYSWEATLLPAELSGATNFAYATARLSAETQGCDDPRSCPTPVRGDTDSLDVQLIGSFPSDVGSFKGNGSLQIDLPVENGDYFFLTVMSSTTANVSTVPLPSGIYLFACGLIGLMLIQINRSQVINLA